MTSILNAIAGATEEAQQESHAAEGIPATAQKQQQFVGGC